MTFPQRFKLSILTFRPFLKPTTQQTTASIALKELGCLLQGRCLQKTLTPARVQPLASMLVTDLAQGADQGSQNLNLCWRRLWSSPLEG